MPQNWAADLLNKADVIAGNVTAAVDHAAAQAAAVRATLADVRRDTVPPAAQRAIPAAGAAAAGMPVASWVAPVLILLLLVLVVAAVRQRS